jgi:hypothetical protein
MFSLGQQQNKRGNIMLNKALNADQKAVSLIETHQMDGAARIAKANISRYVMGTRDWDYWNHVLTQIDIRRDQRRIAKRNLIASAIIALVFAYGDEFSSAAAMVV